jgi:hypothetical protein
MSDRTKWAGGQRHSTLINIDKKCINNIKLKINFCQVILRVAVYCCPNQKEEWT